jgi:hypothetical protein
MKAQAERAVGIDETPPFAFVDGDRFDDHPMAACIVYEHFG